MFTLQLIDSFPLTIQAKPADNRQISLNICEGICEWMIDSGVYRLPPGSKNYIEIILIYSFPGLKLLPTPMEKCTGVATLASVLIASIWNLTNVLTRSMWVKWSLSQSTKLINNCGLQGKLMTTIILLLMPKLSLPRVGIGNGFANSFNPESCFSANLRYWRWGPLSPPGTSGNFPAHVSAESPSSISPNPSEVMSEVSELYNMSF